MKHLSPKKLIGLITLFTCLMLCATACRKEQPQTVPDETTGTVTENAESSDPASSGTDTEPPTAPETDTEPETEPALFEPAGQTTLSGKLQPQNGAPLPSARYTERPTSSDGTVTLRMAGNTELHFNSVFYGHDSAVNRDMSEYGQEFQPKTISQENMPDGCLFGSFTGDLYDDMVYYANGVLTIRPAIVKTGHTFEYNGKTEESVIASRESSFSFGEAQTYTVPDGPEATVRGVGDFDGNAYTDILLCGKDGSLFLIYGSEKGFSISRIGTFHADAESLYAGDVNGDRLWDLVSIDKNRVTVALNTGDGTDFTVQNETVFSFDKPYSAIAVGDVNQDGRTDVVYYETETRLIRTLFGRGDGFFGPRPDEMGNTNLFGEARSRRSGITRIAIGDMTGDKAGDLFINCSGASGKGFSLMIQVYDPPYDYSLFGFVTPEGRYKMYTGGRWHDHSESVKNAVNGKGVGDGDHVILYDSDDGIHWNRRIEGPAFYLGIEQGINGTGKVGEENWWVLNTLEPEVIYVDGVYHMFIQSTGITQSDYYGDYLGYASSTDGIHFTRKTDSPIIRPDADHDFTQFKDVYGYEIGFNHEEVIYVPDDPDGQCFWLYTGHFVNNRWAGYVRIRSADPTCFYWDKRENAPGFAQIGNQIGYISDYDGKGNRLFLRITFTGYDQDGLGSRTVPTLQYSVDGLSFQGLDIQLASVDVTDPVTQNNHNVYFLGFCTLNGTGEIPKNADGSYRLTYLATTANAPGGMPIFHAEAGVGEMNFTLTVK